MNTLFSILALVTLILVLWVVYRIGQILLRILTGLIFLTLLSAGTYYLYLRSFH